MSDSGMPKLLHRMKILFGNIIQRNMCLFKDTFKNTYIAKFNNIYKIKCEQQKNVEIHNLNL